MIYFILILCFVLRAFPRVILKNSYVSDSYFHLYCACVIRKNAFRLPKKLPGVVLDHEYTYPFLYHYLLAIFPLKAMVWAERLSGAVFDSIGVAIVYFFCSWLFEGWGRSYAPEIAAGLYAFSPALLRIGSGPRAYNGSPRTMAETLYVLHITTGFLGIYENSVVWLIVSVMSGAMLTVTAKFGNQVLIVFGLLFIVFCSVKYGAILAGCFALSLLVGGRKSLETFLGQLRHSMFYAKYLQRIFLYPYIRSVDAYAKSLAYGIYGLVARGRLKSFLTWYYSEPFYLHILVTTCPQFLIIPYCLRKELGFSDVFVLVWSMAGLSAFFATRAVKPLMFLGEGERYLEYALLPSIILLMKYAWQPCYILAYLLLGYSILSAVYYQTQYFTRFRAIDGGFNTSEEIFQVLRRECDGVTLPIGSFHWQTLYRSSGRVVTIGGNIDERLLPYETFMHVFGNFPYPSSDLKVILQEYQVRYIITDDESLDHYKRIMQAPEMFDKAIELFKEASRLKLFRVVPF